MPPVSTSNSGRNKGAHMVSRVPVMCVISGGALICPGACVWVNASAGGMVASHLFRVR